MGSLAYGFLEYCELRNYSALAEKPSIILPELIINHDWGIRDTSAEWYYYVNLRVDRLVSKNF
jgi:hypothetical protein